MATETYINCGNTSIGLIQLLRLTIVKDGRNKPVFNTESDVPIEAFSRITEDGYSRITENYFDRIIE